MGCKLDIPQQLLEIQLNVKKMLIAFLEFFLSVLTDSKKNLITHYLVETFFNITTKLSKILIIKL